MKTRTCTKKKPAQKSKSDWTDTCLFKAAVLAAGITAQVSSVPQAQQLRGAHRAASWAHRTLLSRTTQHCCPDAPPAPAWSTVSSTGSVRIGLDEFKFRSTPATLACPRPLETPPGTPGTERGKHRLLKRERTLGAGVGNKKRSFHPHTHPRIKETSATPKSEKSELKTQIKEEKHGIYSVLSFQRSFSWLRREGWASNVSNNKPLSYYQLLPCLLVTALSDVKSNWCYQFQNTLHYRVPFKNKEQSSSPQLDFHTNRAQPHRASGCAPGLELVFTFCFSCSF